MAKSYLQDAPVKIGKKIHFGIFWIMVKNHLQDASVKIE